MHEKRKHQEYANMFAKQQLNAHYVNFPENSTELFNPMNTMTLQIKKVEKKNGHSRLTLLFFGIRGNTYTHTHTHTHTHTKEREVGEGEEWVVAITLVLRETNNLTNRMEWTRTTINH